MKIFQTTYLIVVGMILLLISGCTAKKTHPEHHIGIEVHDAWVRAVPPNMTITAAYMTLHNHSNMEDALVSVETPVAGVVESHSVEEKNGVMSMKPVDSIPVTAGLTESVTRFGGRSNSRPIVVSPAESSLFAALTHMSAGPFGIVELLGNSGSWRLIGP